MNTALEMRLLVQAFLKARIAVLPKRPIQLPQPVAQEESQEDWGDFSFDLDDPEFTAVLDQAESEASSAIKKNEEQTCKVASILRGVVP